MKGYICQYWQRYNPFAGGKITQCIHQIACIYIVVPQQKWNNNYSETTYKLEGVLQTCLQDEKLTTTKKS